MYTPILKPFSRKEYFQPCSSLQMVFWEKRYGSILRSSSTSMIFTWCKLFIILLFWKTLIFMVFSLFSSAVLLQHKQIRTFFMTPVTFSDWWDMDQTRLASYVTRFNGKSQQDGYSTKTCNQFSNFWHTI